MSIFDDLQKPEFSGLSDQQAADALNLLTDSEGVLIPATTVNQLFASLDLTGHVQDIAADHQHQFRHKMASVILSIGGDHPFNFIPGTAAGDGNLAMLDQMIANIPALSAKMTAFKALASNLSSRKTKRYNNVTAADVAKARAATLNVDDWVVINNLSSHRLVLSLLQGMPEPSRVSVELSESVDGVAWTPWRPTVSFNGLDKPGVYIVTIPFNGLQRRIRWKSDKYQLNGDVSLQ